MGRRKNLNPKRRTQKDTPKVIIQKDNVFEAVTGNRLNGLGIVIQENDGFSFSSQSSNISHKKIKFKPGTVALREIRRYQKTTNLLIKKAPFRRLVKEIIYEKSNSTFDRISKDALNVLQEATENYLTSFLYPDAVLCAVHANRVTVKAKDVQLAKRISKK